MEGAARYRLSAGRAERGSEGSERRRGREEVRRELGVTVDRVLEISSRDPVADEQAPVDCGGGDGDVGRTVPETAAVHGDDPLAAAGAGQHEAGGLALA